MRRDFDYREYDAESFVRDHPEDPWLPEAERAATKEADRARGAREGETNLDAKHRIDQAFDGLDTLLADRMAEYGRGEAAFMKVAFVDREAQEIWNRHLMGIERAASLEERAGGRFARDEEIRLFRERIDDNPTFLKERQQLADMQTARATAVSAMIGHHHDRTLERLGLDHAQETQNPQALPPQTQERVARQASFDELVRQEQENERERDLER
jgi:hypothetical protein